MPGSPQYLSFGERAEALRWAGSRAERGLPGFVPERHHSALVGLDLFQVKRDVAIEVPEEGMPSPITTGTME